MSYLTWLRALSDKHGESGISENCFLTCCDVFIWIGVCKDVLLYWVLTSEELIGTGKLGSQHRNENTGMDGATVFEGQVFMTEDELKPFSVEERNILQKVIEKGKRR